MIKSRRLATVLLLMVASAAGACRAPSPADPVTPLSTYYAALRLSDDGTLDVTEDFVLGAEPPGDRLVRRIPIDRFDRVSNVLLRSGSADPRPLTSADPSGGLDVAIPLERNTQMSETSELTYRVDGAVAVRGGRGLLSWPVLPTGHPFAIEAASVALVLAPGVRTAVDPPPPAPGWRVTARSNGWLFEASHVPARVPVTVNAELSINAIAVPEPDWQGAETRTRQLMPAFVAGALFILVAGGGILFMIRWQFGSHTPDSAPRELDPAAAARGLVVSGWVLIVFGVVATLATWRWFTFFGVWPVVVPLSVVVVGVMFLPESRRLLRSR